MRGWSIFLSVSLVFAACGGDKDDPAPDAGSPDSTVIDASPDAAQVDAPSDAPVMQCEVVDDCPCFTNYDCPAPTACSSAEGDPSCLPGPRGTGEAGVACTGEDDCKSSICLEGPGNDLLCSDVCDDGSDCPASLPRCISIQGTKLCVRP